MAVNDDLADDVVRRAARLEKRINGIWKELLPLLRQVERDLIEKVEAGVGPRGGSFRTDRAQRLLRQVRQIIEGGASDFEQRLHGLSFETAEVEAVAAARSLEKTVPVSVNWETPSARLLESLIISAPFTQEGAILESFVRGWKQQTIDRVQGAIRVGLIEGEGVEPIAKRVASVMEVQNRQKARAIVRTYSNHAFDRARLATYEANADVIAKEQWLTTLDHRTCPRCGVLDNKTFPLGKGPRPPRHANCRCVRVPITRGAEALRARGVIGERAAKTAEGLNGAVPADMRFPDWLKRQPEGVQKEVLGATRFQMFKNGTNFDTFVNDENEIIPLRDL